MLIDYQKPWQYSSSVCHVRVLATCRGMESNETGRSRQEMPQEMVCRIAGWNGPDSLGHIEIHDACQMKSI